MLDVEGMKCSLTIHLLMCLDADEWLVSKVLTPLTGRLMYVHLSESDR